MFDLLHIDDEQTYLSQFREFLEKAAPNKFRIIGNTSANWGLSYLSMNPDVTICVVDFELIEKVSPNDNEIWDGLSFVQAAKMISPSTNFIVITNQPITSELKKLAAEAGCFDVIKKRSVKLENAERLVNQLEYACYYSEYFVKRRSDARLNFSQSIAHNLRTAIIENRNIVKSIRDANSDAVQEDTVDYRRDKLDILVARYNEMEERLSHVLGFYSKSKLNPKESNLFELMQELVASVDCEGISVECRDRSCAHGYFDPVLVRLAVKNLVENSIKATSELSEKDIVIIIRICTREVMPGKEIFEIEVEDNGIGLKAGTEDEITLPMVHFDNLKKGVVNFGIGCAESEKIARLHRNGTLSGSLTHRNAVMGSGCVATLKFPKRIEIDEQ